MFFARVLCVGELSTAILTTAMFYSLLQQVLHHTFFQVLHGPFLRASIYMSIQTSKGTRVVVYYKRSGNNLNINKGQDAQHNGQSLNQERAQCHLSS